MKPVGRICPGGFRQSTQQKLSHLLSWVEPIQGLAGAAVELSCDAVELDLAETRGWLEDLLLLICAEHSLPLPLPAINVPLLT